MNPGTKAKVKVAQLSPTLCDPMDYSPLGSSVYGILQARMLEWVAIPFSIPIQGSNPDLLRWQVDPLPFEPREKPVKLSTIDYYFKTYFILFIKNKPLGI